MQQAMSVLRQFRRTAISILGMVVGNRPRRKSGSVCKWQIIIGLSGGMFIPQLVSSEIASGQNTMWSELISVSVKTSTIYCKQFEQ